jgi:polyisoprenyl-phosphate glycosyltransferase
MSVSTEELVDRREPFVSVVLPCFNESSNIERITAAIKREFEFRNLKFEIVFVDDGSEDDTVAQVSSQRKMDDRVVLVRLARNFGKEAALSAGLDYASGDAVIMMDADMQHPPEAIPLLIDQWIAGAEMVVAVRSNPTSTSSIRNWLTRRFYSLFEKMSNVKLMPNAGDFRLLDRRAVICLQALPERTRFMKGLYQLIGLNTAVVDYEVRLRDTGKSKFGARRLWRFALDGLTSFTSLPLRIWSYVGMLLALPAAAYALLIVIEKIVYGIDAPGYASVATMIAFFSGIQLFGLGVFGEYLARVFEESKRRPLYIVSEALGATISSSNLAHGGIELPPRGAATRLSVSRVEGQR